MVARRPCNEAAAELMLRAFFQRVLNDGGTVDRGYHVRRGPMDLLVRWPRTDADWKRQEQRDLLSVASLLGIRWGAILRLYKKLQMSEALPGTMQRGWWGEDGARS